MRILYIMLLITSLSFAQAIEDKNKTITTASDTKIEKEDSSIVQKIGFSSKDGIVSIDTNKAKDYFCDLGKNIKSKSKELSIELKSKTLKVTKDIGKNIKVFADDINKFKNKIKAEINGSI